MRNIFLIIIVFQFCSCGGYLNLDNPYYDQDTEVLDIVNDTTILMEIDCIGVCDGFRFTDCEEIVLKNLPVGKFLFGYTCENKCIELIEIYLDMSKNLNFNCLYKTNTCAEVEYCFDNME